MGEEKKESRRVRYTKKLIRDSFFELLEEYSVNKITVKMISEQADVNRGTFYAYYKDAYDLLEKTEEEFYNIVNAQFKSYQYDEHTREAVIGVLKNIEKNIGVCRVLFGKNGDADFLKKVLYIVHDQTIGYWQKRFPNAGIQYLEMTYNYLVSGSSGVLLEWIGDDAGITAEQITDYLMGMWEKGLSSLNTNA